MIAVADRIIRDLNEKEKRTIIGRFGLKGKVETLAAVGKNFGLSRERIRQIENNAKRKIDKDFSDFGEKILTEINDKFSANGGVIINENLPGKFIEILGNEEKSNYLRLILTISKQFENIDETKELKNAWRLTNIKKEKIVATINKIVSHFKSTGVLQSFNEIISQTPGLEKLDKNFVAAVIAISKKLALAKNNFIGLSIWPSVNPKNVRDKIYYVLKNDGKPMHFMAITEKISEMKFDNKKIVRPTVHNELISDKRFVLIGRGLYALREWGYSDGTIYDVIKNLLQNSKTPLSLGEIIATVSKARKVKKNTIMINLQTKKEFKKVASGYIYEKL